jgi:hypothetical protein
MKSTVSGPIQYQPLPLTSSQDSECLLYFSIDQMYFKVWKKSGLFLATTRWHRLAQEIDDVDDFDGWWAQIFRPSKESTTRLADYLLIGMSADVNEMLKHCSEMGEYVDYFMLLDHSSFTDEEKELLDTDPFKVFEVQIL